MGKTQNGGAGAGSALICRNSGLGAVRCPYSAQVEMLRVTGAEGEEPGASGSG